MAIQPIDLQALFSQVDKVGKNQAVLREGQQIQAALQQIQTQKKNEEDVQAVNETREMGDEAEKIKDDKGRKPGQGSSGGRAGSGNGEKEEDESSGKEAGKELFRDPALGRNIDISG